MPQAVAHSVDDFVEAVAEAIAIVLLVSLVSLGLRTGMVVVISIPLVLAATALCMYLFHIGLHKVSLGTLILALGLLVDDAIIAVETMAVKLEQGFDRVRAAAFAYTSTAFPMLTGTLVTVSGFLPIALAKSATGEYTRSIFEVSAIALLLSWLAAVIVIPLLGYRILSEHPTRRAFGNPDTDAARRRRGPSRYLRRQVLPPVARLDRLVRRSSRRVLIVTLAVFVVGPCGIRARAAAILSELRPPRASGRPAPAGRRVLCRDAAGGAASRRRSQRAVRRSITSSTSSARARRASFCRSISSSPPPNFAQFVVTAKSVKEREQLAPNVG